MHMHGGQSDFPESLDEFEKRYGMRFVMGSEPPIEEQKPYARGAYVKLRLAGKVIEVLDSFFGRVTRITLAPFFHDRR